MKVLIVDNEAQIRDGLVEMLQMLPFAISQIAEATGVKEGLGTIASYKPDIVFLDVEMDDGTGFDLLKQLDVINFQLIFITAHNKYAIDAFRFSAIHFLQKPIDFEELTEAFERAQDSIKSNDFARQLAVMQESLANLHQQDKKIVLRDAKSLYFVKTNEIIYCEASGSYTTFYLQNEDKIIVSKPLKEYEQLLEPSGFIRTHHSFLVNANHIVRLDKQDGGDVIFENGKSVPVSQRKWDQIVHVLENRR